MCLSVCVVLHYHTIMLLVRIEKNHLFLIEDVFITMFDLNCETVNSLFCIEINPIAANSRSHDDTNRWQQSHNVL